MDSKAYRVTHTAAGHDGMGEVTSIIGLREDQVPPRLWKAAVDGLQAVEIGDGETYSAYAHALEQIYRYDAMLKRHGWQWE